MSSKWLLLVSLFAVCLTGVSNGQQTIFPAAGSPIQDQSGEAPRSVMERSADSEPVGGRANESTSRSNCLTVEQGMLYHKKLLCIIKELPETSEVQQTNDRITDILRRIVIQVGTKGVPEIELPAPETATPTQETTAATEASAPDLEIAATTAPEENAGVDQQAPESGDGNGLETNESGGDPVNERDDELEDDEGAEVERELGSEPEVEEGGERGDEGAHTEEDDERNDAQPTDAITVEGQVVASDTTANPIENPQTSEQENCDEESKPKTDESEKELLAKLQFDFEEFDLTSFRGWKRNEEIIGLLEKLEKTKSDGCFGGFQKEIKDAMNGLASSRDNSKWALDEVSQIFGLPDSTSQIRQDISDQLADHLENNPANWLAPELIDKLQMFGLAHIGAYNKLSASQKVDAPILLVPMVICECHHGCEFCQQTNVLVQSAPTTNVAPTPNKELNSLADSINHIFDAIQQEANPGAEMKIAEPAFAALFELVGKLDTNKFEALWITTFEHFRDNLSNADTDEKVAKKLVGYLYKIVLPARNVSESAGAPTLVQFNNARADIFKIATSNKSITLSKLARKRFRDLNLSDQQILSIYLNQ